MGRAIVFAFLLSLSLMHGCAGGQMPPACAEKSGASLANCVYVNAVLGQNPFFCYSIQDVGMRTTCLKDATDSAMKKRLENLKPSARDAIFMPESEPTQPGNLPAGKPGTGGAASGGTGATAPGGGGSQAEEQSIDQSIYNAAVEANDLQLCLQIATDKTLKSCVSQIARKTKNPELCKTLKDNDLLELCNLYSLGD